MDDYVRFKSYCLTTDVQFHAYATEQDKILAVVVRGLPKINKEDIITELVNLDVKPLSCQEIQKNPNSLYPIYKVTFPADITFQQINKIPFLFSTRVYWKKYNKSRPYIQCFRCQAHGHTSANCNKNYKFVKCAGSHDSRICQKSPDTLATCLNC